MDRIVAPADHANAGFRSLQNQGPGSDPTSAGDRDVLGLAGVSGPDVRGVDDAYQPFKPAGLRVPVPKP